MNIYKNPFAIRASERIETDEMFLELFSSEPLVHLEEKNDQGKLWGCVTSILSSPGAGKTTLLRLFSPSILQRITERNSAYKKLKKLDVIDSERIKKCGVYLQLGRDYEFLEDDALFNEVEQKRVFLSLLNARIVLATLKSCMSLAGIKYTALDQITYSPEELVPEFGDFKAEFTGKELLDWAAEQERRICEFLDSFVMPDEGIQGSNSLFALKAMKASWFTYKGERLCDEFIFQIDDGHKLTKKQKKTIREEAVELRLPVTLWIAERLETLSTTDILSDKNIKDRDDQTIHLENAKKGIFNPMVKNISTLRSAFSTDGIILASALASDTTINYKALYNEASKKYQSQLEKLYNYDNYQECVAAINTQDPYERVLNMRALLMHASRQGSGGVMNLFGYTAQDLEWIVGPLMPMVKEVMPGEIAKLPQYYGFSTLIDLASQNVEQFLDLSAKMYELLVAKKISDPSHYVLTAEEQDGIIREFAKNRLEDIKRLPRGNKIYGFLMHLIDFCLEVTFTPSYSYRSVTGFAVKEENSGKWGKDGFWFQEEANDELSTILKDCLSYNFLMKQGITQGKKDQKWTIFYLNSWLCAYAHLPLERGGWRPLTLHKLNSWL
ncbi:MAG: hypothetical protein J6S94_05020 [Bacteroidaceae bacterium]|nr:hypothetical protein [Bacteroidaceae bacterium]